MRRLLIVEDDLSSQSLIKRIVEKIGYEPVITDSVKDALNLLRKDASIETAIVDMQLKDGWGVSLINQIRVAFSIDISIIIYSGNLDVFEEWKDEGVSVDAKIEKNGDLGKLVIKLKELWEQRSLQMVNA